MNNFIEEMQEARKNTASYIIDISSLNLISKEKIKLGNREVTITPTAFKDILKISGITNQILQHLNDVLNPKAGFLLIKEIMKALAKKQARTKINLIFDTSSLNIIRVSYELNESAVSIRPDQIEALLTELVSNNKILLTQTLITDSGTKVSFNVKFNVEIPLKMPGEAISYGKQITWDMFGDVQSNDFVERLVCTNGMTAIEPSNKGIILNGSSDVSEWYNTLFLDLINPNKKVIDHYESKALEAMQTNLSVFEFNKVKGYVMTLWKDDIDRIIKAIGDDKSWKIKYEQRGIDLEKLNAGQLRNCPTPVNSWDTINLLTDLASHQYNTRVSMQAIKNTQKMAGQLLNSSWDENSQLHNVPNFEKRRII